MFTVDDACHPQRKEIYEKLDKLMEKIEDTGKYVYNWLFLGQKVVIVRSLLWPLA